MRPVGRGGIANGLDGGGNEGTCRIVGGIPLAIPNTEMEVAADILLVARIRLNNASSALNDRGVVERLRLYPAFDRELTEVGVLGIALGGNRVAFLLEGKRLEDGGLILASEIHRLTAAGAIGIERIGSFAEASYALIAIAHTIVVGIVTFVFFEREHPVFFSSRGELPHIRREANELGRLHVLRRNKASEIAEEVFLSFIGRVLEAISRQYDFIEARRHTEEHTHERVRIARICHPQRSGVGVLSVDVDRRHDRFLLVADIIAVRVGRSQTVKPRIVLEVIAVALGRNTCAVEVAGLDLLRPVVGLKIIAPRLNRSLALRCPGIGNEVARSVAGDSNAALAEHRVHTVEEFVVVIHAVLIGVGLER